MCMVSMVSDDYLKQNRWVNDVNHVDIYARNELALLRKEIEALKKLLEAAKEYDEETGQPNCEKEDNVKLLIDLAKKLDIDLEDIFE